MKSLELEQLESRISLVEQLSQGHPALSHIEEISEILDQTYSFKEIERRNLWNLQFNILTSIEKEKRVGLNINSEVDIALPIKPFEIEEKYFGWFRKSSSHKDLSKLGIDRDDSNCVDIILPVGTKVYSPIEGIVANYPWTYTSGTQGGPDSKYANYDNRIMILSPDLDLAVWFRHLAPFSSKDQRILSSNPELKSGDIIGSVGRTGTVYNDEWHLHMGFYKLKDSNGKINLNRKMESLRIELSK